MIQVIRKHKILRVLFSPRLIKYIVVGGIGGCVDLFFLFLFVQYGNMWYLLSEAIATIIAGVANFLFNTFWTYGDAMKALDMKLTVSMKSRLLTKISNELRSITDVATTTKVINIVNKKLEEEIKFGTKL